MKYVVVIQYSYILHTFKVRIQNWIIFGSTRNETLNQNGSIDVSMNSWRKLVQFVVQNARLLWMDGCVATNADGCNLQNYGITRATSAQFVYAVRNKYIFNSIYLFGVLLSCQKLNEIPTADVQAI